MLGGRIAALCLIVVLEFTPLFGLIHQLVQRSDFTVLIVSANIAVLLMAVLSILSFDVDRILSHLWVIIILILTGPFMYSILENFVLAILRLERLRLVVAFDPTTINPEVVSIFSFFFGPIVLSIVIGLTAFLLSKKNAIVTI